MAEPSLANGSIDVSSGSPTVTCRNCRCQIPLDSIDTHDCEQSQERMDISPLVAPLSSPPLKPAPSPKTPTKQPSRINVLANDVAAANSKMFQKANSFFESFLDDAANASQAGSMPPPPPRKAVDANGNVIYRKRSGSNEVYNESYGYYQEGLRPVEDVYQLPSPNQMPMMASPYQPMASPVFQYPPYAQVGQAYDPNYQYYSGQLDQQFYMDQLAQSQAPLSYATMASPVAAPATPVAAAPPPSPVVASSPVPMQVTSPVHAAVSPTNAAALPRAGADKTGANPVQCRVRGVRVNRDKVALYSITSTIPVAQSPTSLSKTLLNTINNRQLATTSQITIERRYREFYEFALGVYAMFPNNQELWSKLPPKTFCARPAERLSDGFLIRRKAGLDDFVRKAIELMNFSSGPGANPQQQQGSIGQWYLVRRFLNLPPTLGQSVTKDRSLPAAMQELKRHAQQTTGWNVYRQTNAMDVTYEKKCDGFHMVKRVRTCSFPARAIFDMITNKGVAGSGSSSSGSSSMASATSGAAQLDSQSSQQAPGNSTPSEEGGEALPSDEMEASSDGLGGVGGAGTSGTTTTANNSNSTKTLWNVLVESEETLKRESAMTWTERTVFKPSLFSLQKLVMTSLKSWKVEENGSIVIVMIPDEDAKDPQLQTAQQSQQQSQQQQQQQQQQQPQMPQQPTTPAPDGFRVDCILGGWVITPLEEETCTVTWIMQANFGECDPQKEFYGTSNVLSNYVARSILLSWSEELWYLVQALQQAYEPSVYRKLGPLLSTEEIKNLKLNHQDTIMSAGNPHQEVRVYMVAMQMEPSMCLLIHKNTNRNVLIFKTNYRTKGELDPYTPLKAEWIMFEKSGNPREALSAVEKNTTYNFSTKQIAPNVFHFSLGLLKRDCVLRYDPMYGFSLFTTINGRPSTLLKRVYLHYARANSLLSFAKLEEISLVGENDTESNFLK